MHHTFDKRSYPANPIQFTPGTQIRCTTCHKGVPIEQVLEQQEAESKHYWYEGLCRG